MQIGLGIGTTFRQKWVPPLTEQIRSLLFGSGEQGVWYDVESFRDAWNSVGSELTPAVAPVFGEASVVSPGVYRIYSSAGAFSSVGAVASTTAVIGRKYIVSFNVDSITTPGGGLVVESVENTAVTTLGPKSFLVTAANTSLHIKRNSSACDIQISGLSAKEWLGVDKCPLFQDAAGTLPTYMPGQGQIDPPVGLMLDKRKGLERGPERFSDDLVAFVGESSRISAGVYRCYSSTGTYNLINLGGGLTLGNWYELQFTVDSVTVQGSGLVLEGVSLSANATVLNTVGRKSVIFSATQPYVGLKRAAGACDYQFSSVSIRPLNGNHAYQTTTTSRPTLSARYNLFTNTVFSGAAVGVPGTAPTGWSSNFNTASITGISSLGNDYAIQLTASAQRLFFAQSFSAASSTTYSLSCLVSENAGISIEQILNFTGTPTGATLQWFINGVQVSASAVPPAGSRAELRLVNGATAGTPAGRVGIGCSTNATGVVSVAQPDVRVTNDGVGLPAYQRVVDANTYDTMGFPLYLKFDGVDDGLQTASVDFSGTGKVTLWAAIRKLSDASVGTVAELSAEKNANTGVFALFAPLSGNGPNLAWFSKGTVEVQATKGGEPAPQTKVLVGLGDISARVSKLRGNGSDMVSNVGSQGVGNYGNYPLYIGRRGGASLPFNGRLYSLIVRGAQTPLSQIEATELYMKKKVGIA